ncbi:MAG: hypothetical protein ACQCN4_02505 [Candidatus Bathyarchaeia archaeon]
MKIKKVSLQWKKKRRFSNFAVWHQEGCENHSIKEMKTWNP